MLAHVFDRLAMQVRRAKDVPRAVGFHTPPGEGGHGQQKFARPIEGIACFADFIGFNGT